MSDRWDIDWVSTGTSDAVRVGTTERTSSFVLTAVMESVSNSTRTRLRECPTVEVNFRVNARVEDRTTAFLIFGPNISSNRRRSALDKSSTIESVIETVRRALNGPGGDAIC